ncbi:YitT family protein [Acholeplasma granularum]|uniref:YitT family protein n=1 Tax=Acholeplasma granularum TaxID=264635 RepID=UPI0004B5297F|nr:YitT family protein [Acholeplasma granularum]
MNKNFIKSYLWITIGVIIFNFAFYFFLKPMNLITGGMLGFSLFLEPFIPITVGLAYFILNMITLLIGAILLGKDFLIKTVYASIISPLIVTLLELLHISDMLVLSQIDAHYQMLVASIAAGVLSGLGIGIVLRYNATTGGMDIVQKIINKYLKVPFSVAVYLTDGLVILLGAYISIQSGLFATLAMLLTAYMIEKIAVFGRSSFALMIITQKHEEIKNEIYKSINRGVTRLRAVGGYSGIEKELILTTVTRQQLYSAKDLITKVDPNAFTLIISTKEVLGQGFHRDDFS